MLRVPVSTASAEKSFSKLKLIKTYLRSTMSQERLSALSVLSIEAEIAASVSYDIILKKCRKETEAANIRLGVDGHHTLEETILTKSWKTTRTQPCKNQQRPSTGNGLLAWVLRESRIVGFHII
ncbi:hypothetical protein TNCV_5042511 [Trichonephila clavipes]|nr:hypothetical protein TNCV_5042511 [Trichonephila clavipes]